MFHYFFLYVRSVRATPSLGARRCVVLQIPFRARNTLSRDLHISVLPRSVRSSFVFLPRDSKIAGIPGIPPLPPSISWSTSSLRSFVAARAIDGFFFYPLFFFFSRSHGSQHALGIVASPWRQSWIKYYFENANVGSRSLRLSPAHTYLLLP